MTDPTKKLFPYPFTPETLPPHQARVLTAEQRLSLPEFEILRDEPAKGFITLQTPDEGHFVLRPERMNGDDPMTEVRYNVHNGYDLRNIMDRDKMTPIEADLAYRAFSGYDVGAVWSQEKAIELFDYARRHTFDASPEEQLLAAGFKKQETAGVYRKGLGKHSYSLIEKPNGVWLMFETNGKSSWNNLLILNTHTTWATKENVSPILWPDTFSDPKRTLTGLAVRMTEIWSPDLLPKAKKGRKPKP